MQTTEHTSTGVTTRDLTTPELKELAKEGNREAIKELISLAGGWDALTETKKNKVTRLLYGDDVEL